MQPPLAMTLGDPAGIGPEIILKAWSRRTELGLPPFVVVGGADVLTACAERTGIACDFHHAENFAKAGLLFATHLPVFDLAADEDGANLAWQSLAIAAKLALSGDASGIVTAPVSKAAIAAIHPGFLGQTEFFASACSVPEDDTVMLLAGPSVRAVPLTVHCPLSQVPGRITRDLIERRTQTVHRAMQQDFGIACPRIAIAGLNPHAGEDGHLGREEIDIIAPAISALRARGLDASGPFPADALFAPHKRATYDVAIAMYHDQALAPMKALDFDKGVNMTLGLPIVRTSPDHGTAYDIAGQGVADPGAMIAAICLAGEVAARRRAG